jgi:LytS/YehU family sensor histidine kinase
MNGGEIAAVVSIVSMALTYFGIQIDPGLVNGAVSGVFALIAFGAAIWSWQVHSKNQT